MSNTGLTSHNTVRGLWNKLQGQGVGAVLARGASGSFIVMVISAGLVFAVNVLLARLLGVSQYGIYTYVLAWTNIVLLITKVGMEGTLVRFVSAYNAQSKWGLLRGILRYSLKLVLVINLLVGVALTLALWYSYDQIDPDLAATFVVALVLVPVLSLTALRNGALRAFKHVVKASVEGIVRPAVIGVLAVGFYLYAPMEMHAVQAMIFSLAGAVISFLIGSYWLIKIIPSQIYQHDPDSQAREWLKVSLPMFFMSGMYLVLHQTDTIMIGMFLDTDQVGVYSVAIRIAGLVTFGLLAANSVVAPLISELYSTGNHKELQRMVTLAVRGVAAFTLVCAIALVVMGEFVLGIFGDEFVAGYLPLLVLMAAQVVNALAGPAGFLMTMTGHHNQAAYIIGTSALVNIVLNAVLIMWIGILGAAIATATATVLWNVAMLVYVKRKLNINSTVFAR